MPTETAQEVKRGRGRPPGAKNKPKTAVPEGDDPFPESEEALSADEILKKFTADVDPFAEEEDDEDPFGEADDEEEASPAAAKPSGVTKTASKPGNGVATPPASSDAVLKALTDLLSASSSHDHGRLLRSTAKTVEYHGGLIKDQVDALKGYETEIVARLDKVLDGIVAFNDRLKRVEALLQAGPAIVAPKPSAPKAETPKVDADVELAREAFMNMKAAGKAGTTWRTEKIVKGLQASKLPHLTVEQAMEVLKKLNGTVITLAGDGCTLNP